MTNSSTTSHAAPPNQQVEQTASFSWGRAFLTLIFRLLLLGIGGTALAIVGIAIAQFYPARSQELPLAEKLLQSSEALFHDVKQLPKTWHQPDSSPPDSPAVTPAVTSAVTPATSSAAVTTPITDTERQQLQTELTQLQAELQTLNSNTTEPLADRVEEIQKRIQAIQEKLSSVSASPEVYVASTTSHADDGKLRVTLPSDALFEDKETTLRAGREAILDNIVTDLKSYPGATIQIIGHTDNQAAADTDRHQSLEQAKAVQQYLASKLEEVHWVTIGQGHNQPIAAEDQPENRQRNRRIEIVIEP